MHLDPARAYVLILMMYCSDIFDRSGVVKHFEHITTAYLKRDFDWCTHTVCHLHSERKFGLWRFASRVF